MNPLYHASASELASHLRDRALRATDLVDAHIARIEEVDGCLNAVIARRFDAARAEAREADARLDKGGDLPPLLGVPCTVKEFLGVKGMPHTGGVVARRGITAEKDGTCVARIREAGAIVMGVTNAPEGGLWHETNNRIYGRTNNPWDTRRTCGGSSGGEAAIIAAGGSPFGLGSDIGGSVRLPAAFCGIYAHKPSARTVPETGHFPPGVHVEACHPFSCGPMTRSAFDLMPLLRLMAGPDGHDATTVARSWPDPDSVRPERLDVFPLEHNGRNAPSDDVRAAVVRATRALEARGARIRSIDALQPRIRHGFEMWASVLSSTGGHYADVVGRDGKVDLWRQLAKYPFGRSDHSGAVLFLMVVEKLLAEAPDRVAAYLQELAELRIAFDELLGDGGIVVCPTFSRVATRHRAILLQGFDAQATALFNVLEAPATVVPMGTDRKHDLPVTVQIAARCGNDHLTIAAAQWLEADLGGFRAIDPRERRGRAGRGPL